MKPLHKGLLGLSLLAVAVAAATAVVLQRSASAASRTQTADQEKAPAAIVNNVNSNPGATAPSDGAPSLPCMQPGRSDTSVPVPTDLRVTVKKTPKGRVVKLVQHGHVLALRGSGDRRTAMNEVESTAGSTEKLLWETTDAKTLETVRGELTWDEQAGSPVLGGAVALSALGEDRASTHACRAMSDGGTGFVVVCRVEGQAAAASVETKDPREGVWSQVGPATLVRFDLPMNADGVDTKVIGLEKGGKGTLVRVEASRVAGEKEALLAIAADGRSQPQPVRRLGCVCLL